MPRHEIESQSVPPQRDSEADRPTWDLPAIANALGSKGESRLDQLHGRGARFRVGDPPTLELELFPATGVARLAVEDLTFSLVETDAPKLAPAGIIFESRSETAHRRLSIARSGSATFIYEPLTTPEAAESPFATPDSTDQSSGPDEEQDGPRAALAAPEDKAIAPSPTPETPASKEEQPRVQVAGRIGTEVRFRTTTNGKIVASFPIAIHQEDGSVRWQDIKAFNKLAEKLQADQKLAKGMFVEVTGYEHEREIKGKDGKTRTVKEIYGVVVKPR